MKSLQVISFFLCMILLLGKLTAQTTFFIENHSFPINSRKIYLGVGIGHGYLNRILGINVNYIAQNNWGINLDYRTSTRITAKDLPLDYDPGFCFFNCRPNDYVKTVSLSLIRYFPLPNSFGSAAIELGASLVFHRKANFSRIARSSRNFYTTYYSLKTTAGLPIRISRTYPSSRFVSTQLAAIANLNTLNSFFGLEIFFLFGAVGN